MRRNRLREALEAGRPTLGTHLLSVWPTLVELVGATGHFDYIEFTAEYAPFTMHDLDNLGRALELCDLSGMMKVEQGEYLHQAMRAIGSGHQNVLFADVRTVEDAKLAVAAVRAESPKSPGLSRVGLHGVGMRRDVGTLRDVGNTAYVAALEQAVVAIMVEKVEALENLDAILSVPGIDMVQFGPADYAMGIGHPGQFAHPKVQEAERRVIETALAKGLHPRAEIHEPAQAERYRAMGVRHFCIGWDVSILQRFWASAGAAMRGVEDKAEAPKAGYR
ncbi:HpcH/HpaI aldolase family protein [Elioraea rosea]|uniref:HpcH/HpaI aldolase family protein n=1 Tax=Elioraea rosea TaxID=2492390 RepID=UPI001186C439|nr:aldolase/citrate lyase family protein [Elioraea rosea]